MDLIHSIFVEFETEESLGEPQEKLMLKKRAGGSWMDYTHIYMCVCVNISTATIISNKSAYARVRHAETPDLDRIYIYMHDM